MIKKIIYVSEKYRAELIWAATTYSGGFISEAGKDTYKFVKEHLSKKGIPYQEKNIEPNQVPAGHAYWHQ